MLHVSPVSVRAQSPASAFGQGYTSFHLIAAASTNATLVKAGNVLLVAAQLSGVGGTPAYLKFYDTGTLPVCGTTLPVVKSLMIPSAPTPTNGGGSNTQSFGLEFGNGLGICVTGGIADNDATAVAAATFNINFDYR
jgi:hypothetical protein